MGDEDGQGRTLRGVNPFRICVAGFGSTFFLFDAFLCVFELFFFACIPFSFLFCRLYCFIPVLYAVGYRLLIPVLSPTVHTLILLIGIHHLSTVERSSTS